MRIRLLSAITSLPRYPVGAILDVPDADGIGWIACGLAEREPDLEQAVDQRPVEIAAVAETAIGVVETSKPVETADKPRRRRR